MTAEDLFKELRDNFRAICLQGLVALRQMDQAKYGYWQAERAKELERIEEQRQKERERMKHEHEVFELRHESRFRTMHYGSEGTRQSRAGRKRQLKALGIPI